LESACMPTAPGGGLKRATSSRSDDAVNRRSVRRDELAQGSTYLFCL
jgi:hypothetical protein